MIPRLRYAVFSSCFLEFSWINIDSAEMHYKSIWGTSDQFSLCLTLDCRIHCQYNKNCLMCNYLPFLNAFSLLLLDKQVILVKFQVDFQKEMSSSVALVWVFWPANTATDSTNGVSGGNVQVTSTYKSNSVHFALLVCLKRVLFISRLTFFHLQLQVYAIT